MRERTSSLYGGDIQPQSSTYVLYKTLLSIIINFAIGRRSRLLVVPFSSLRDKI